MYFYSHLTIHANFLFLAHCLKIQCIIKILQNLYYLVEKKNPFFLQIINLQPLMYQIQNLLPFNNQNFTPKKIGNQRDSRGFDI